MQGRSLVLVALLGSCIPPAECLRLAPASKPMLAASCTTPRLEGLHCAEVVPGVGAGRDLPSPSGINTLPTAAQAVVTISILAAIVGGAALIAGPGFDAIRGSGLWSLSRPTWPLLGVIYLAAGIAHFTELEGFENITPPNGTWGWYYTPFSPRVNVLWTGVVEIFGGAWMLFGAAAPLAGLTLPAALGPVVSDGALTLFLLTLVVTPANLYALTHGVRSCSSHRISFMLAGCMRSHDEVSGLRSHAQEPTFRSIWRRRRRRMLSG